MNILFIAHERNLGGASKSLVTLTSELQRRGHRVFVILPLKSGQVYKKLQQNGIIVKKIFFGWWMCPGNWNGIMKLAFRFLYGMEWIAAQRIKTYARKHHIHIIHSNSSAIDVGAMAAYKAGIPHVWHFREFGDLDYNLEFLLGRERSCRIMNQIPGYMIFISENLYQYYKGSVDSEKCRVIYNGISGDYLFCKYGNTFPEMKSIVIFLIAGNLHRNKKQNVAIEAAKILRQRGYDDFRLLIAGAAADLKDSRKFERELKEQAQALMPQYIEFLGSIKDMHSLRKETDIELVCSGREAFGRVTVEAMMSSNPVIASDTGANPELVIPGKNGLLFREGDASSLADQMECFMINRKLIQSMGAYAYDYAKNSFTSEKNTINVESLYQEILDGFKDK